MGLPHTRTGVQLRKDHLEIGGFFCLVGEESADHVPSNNRDDREYNGDHEVTMPRDVYSKEWEYKMLCRDVDDKTNGGTDD